ncbi:hypothetical protein ACHAWF_002680 [Thalassiosira exigua]
MRLAAVASALLPALASPSGVFVGPSSRATARARPTILRDVATEEGAATEEATEAAVADGYAVASAAARRGGDCIQTGPENIPRADREGREGATIPLFLVEKAASLLLDPLTSKRPPSPFDSSPKEKLVVLGTAFLENNDTNKYDVTGISPRNYFVFTPMLAGASVDDFKSITEPIREMLLKQVGDAQQIKNAIVNCFEAAGLPGNDLDEEDLKKELTFIIVGAGPTGIEYAAELLDSIEDNGRRYYKELLPYVRIKIVEAAPSLLRPFEDEMKDEAIRRLTRTIEIEGVEALQPCEILLNKQALWAAGIGPLPITSNTIEALEGTEQAGAQEFGWTWIRGCA